MNAASVAALIGFLVGCIGAFGAAVALRPFAKGPDDHMTFDWADHKARRRFYVLMVFCTVGFLSGIAGFLWGGWTNAPADDLAILWLIALFPLLVLAWAAYGLRKLRN
ncbi:MAG: hypothetical protein SGJ23_05505 [Alphaproteobacteria bacterium]|nr:hypothetical protein [Alphaproteobacteria bacterium]